MQHVFDAAKASAEQETRMFLRAMSHVPADRLTWTPVPGQTKSALHIAAHVAVTAGHFAKMIRHKWMPTGDEIPVLVAEMRAAELALVNLDDVKTKLAANTADVLAAIDELHPEDLDLVLESSQGFSMSMRNVISLAGWHATLHTGQIDYLQTCWGDQEIHF